jgi:hypothetical protein
MVNNPRADYIESFAARFFKGLRELRDGSGSSGPVCVTDVLRDEDAPEAWTEAMEDAWHWENWGMSPGIAALHNLSPAVRCFVEYEAPLPPLPEGTSPYHAEPTSHSIRDALACGDPRCHNAGICDCCWMTDDDSDPERLSQGSIQINSHYHEHICG